MKIRVLTLVIGACAVSACTEEPSVLERAQNDSVVMVTHDDPHMTAAFAKARSTLDGFLAIATDPDRSGDDFALKVGIKDGEDTEYFWITPFSVEGEAFSGRVSNTPQLVSTVKEGETIRFKRADIVDWTYRDVAAGKTRGNFTACAILKNEKAEDAALVQKEYGLDCES